MFGVRLYKLLIKELFLLRKSVRHRDIVCQSDALTSNLSIFSRDS